MLFFEVTLRASLQKCARETVSWRAYPTAGRRLAAIVNFRAALHLVGGVR